MDDSKLVEQLQQEIRELDEMLHRRKAALAALKGKTGKKGGRPRGLRPGSIPALAHAALKASRQPMSLDDLTTLLKKSKDDLVPRDVSLALSRYVRLGQHFVVNEEGKYSLK